MNVMVTTFSYKWLISGIIQGVEWATLYAPKLVAVS